MAATRKTSMASSTPDPAIRPNAVRTQCSAREHLRILAAAELARLQRFQAKLAQAAQIIDVQKKRATLLGDHPAGFAEHRAGLIVAVAELSPQVGIIAACRLLAVPRSSYSRACQPAPDPTPRPRSRRALTPPSKHAFGRFYIAPGLLIAHRARYMPQSDTNARE